MRILDFETIEGYKNHLVEEEKSAATIEKYIRDVSVFCAWSNGREIDKRLMLEYKNRLMEQYADASVNSVLSSLNSLFNYLGWHDCKVKTLKIQRHIFADKDKELTKSEYERLLKAAKSKNNERLYYLMQTICVTGIRVSELKYITTEAVQNRQAIIRCKGKTRTVILHKQLCKMLKGYIKEHNIKSGSVFVTRNGKPLDRSNIWSDKPVFCL